MRQSAGENPEVRYDDIINAEPSLVELAANPMLLPYLAEMIENPRLKSTWIAFKWRGGTTKLHSNHTPSITHNFYHFNGQIRHNLLNVMYAMRDIEPGGGGLRPRDAGLVRWQLNHQKINDDRTIRQADFDSKLRIRFDPAPVLNPSK